MTTENLMCPPGTMYRTPHNHELCMRYWSEEERERWEAEVGGASVPISQVEGEELTYWGWEEGPAQREMKYKLLSENAKAPRKGKYEGDAGIDLAAAETVRVQASSLARVELDVAVQMPVGCSFFMMGRSSTAGRGLLVVNTVIDEGYRGQLFCLVFNMTGYVAMVYAGQYIVQMVLFMSVAPSLELVEVEKLDESERGINAFGSSG